MCTLRHPDHDAVACAVRGWYTESYPTAGYIRERRRFGVYSRYIPAPQDGGVIVEALTREQVAEFLEDARRHFGGAPVGISIDDRQQDAEIGPALVAAGVKRESAWSHLTHVGALPEAPLVAGLTIEPLVAGDVEAFSVAKLKGFANDEAEPSPQRLAEEVAYRHVQMADEGRGLLARVEGEPAAILAYYEGWDRDLCLLTTRVPFRRRGIARRLICHFLTDARAQGCRSVVVGANLDDTPIQLYRRMGFTDEVYWSRGYRLLG
jgi:ribosomal protein S18 acetylase RimI-like enzyme